VSEANAGEGLNALTTHWGWAEAGLCDEDQFHIREYMARAQMLYIRGYQYKRHLLTSMGAWACEAMRRAGLRMLRDYRDYYARRPPLPPEEQRPSLLGLTREQALESEGTLMSRLFAYRPPRFHFPPPEQQLLFLALLGYSDTQAARILCLSRSTLKARWAAIYARVAGVDEELLPASGGSDKRGSEKRAPLLSHLRDRLEELRPTLYDFDVTITLLGH